ncbi:MAG: hypothetical protein IJ532_00925 [Alphaproteobacteria bacterium]|nr:hypothetical protein [Alphaproteobacteria bacterium]
MKTEKMVCVAGVMVPESMVEGRLKALANGRRIHNEMVSAITATRQDEIRELRKAGWKDDDINLHLAAQNNEAAASHGFIRPARTIKAGKPQWGPTMMIH